jgi:flagellar protein FlbD
MRSIPPPIDREHPPFAKCRIGAMMIRLTRLNNQAFMLNSDLVKFVEQAPDTVITLINGEKFIVRENTDEIVQRIVSFRRSVLVNIFTGWDRGGPFFLPPEEKERTSPEPLAER